MSRSMLLQSVLALCFGVCLLLAACWETFNYVRNCKLAEDSKCWQQTKAKIIDEYVNTCNVWRSRWACETKYEPIIKYSFSIKGKEYINSCVQIPGPIFNYRKEANDFLSKYPKNVPTIVYYDGTNPNNSCIEKSLLNDTNSNGRRNYKFGADLGITVMFVCGIFLVLHGIFGHLYIVDYDKK